MLQFSENLYVSFLFVSIKIPTSLEDKNDILLSMFILQSKLTYSNSYSSLMSGVIGGFSFWA